jgi:RNA polymerase sigma-70 factor (ECF subfamily)
LVRHRILNEATGRCGLESSGQTADSPKNAVLFRFGQRTRVQRMNWWGLRSTSSNGCPIVALTEIDRTLLKRCLSEEPGAWKDFVDRFIGLFVHVINHTAHARSVTLSPDDIEDLTAEVFVRLLSNNYSTLRHFRGKSSLATYLTVIARRIVVKEITQRRISEALGHVPAHASSLDAAESQRIESREEVARLLSDLPPREADVIRQFHLEGKSYREISASLGIPENSIGPTLNRARERMRQQSATP